jgi:hypothetical protein
LQKKLKAQQSDPKQQITQAEKKNAKLLSRYMMSSTQLTTIL